MITLEQAIKLATEAHKNQWRNTQNLDNETAMLFMQMDEELYPTVLSNGNKVFIKEETFVMKKPYITHPLAVMNMMSTDEEKIIAVLHDVVEMCNEYYLCEFANTNERYLTKENENSIQLVLTKPIYDALVLLAHSKDLSYSKYIKELSKNKLAVKIKLADMMHNMSESNNPKQKEKYLKALPILLKAL